MYKKACKVVVLRNKAIAFLTSSMPSPSSLLKLPKDSSAEERDTAVNLGRGVEVLHPEYPTLFPEFPPTRTWRGAWEGGRQRPGRNMQLAN